MPSFCPCEIAHTQLSSTTSATLRKSRESRRIRWESGCAGGGFRGRMWAWGRGSGSVRGGLRRWWRRCGGGGTADFSAAMLRREDGGRGRRWVSLRMENQRCRDLTLPGRDVFGNRRAVQSSIAFEQRLRAGRRRGTALRRGRFWVDTGRGLVEPGDQATTQRVQAVGFAPWLNVHFGTHTPRSHRGPRISIQQNPAGKPSVSHLTQSSLDRHSGMQKLSIVRMPPGQGAQSPSEGLTDWDSKAVDPSAVSSMSSEVRSNTTSLAEFVLRA